MKLYELNEQLNNFVWEIDEETGEILNADQLDAIQLARDEKLEQLGLWVKDLNALAEAIKKEKDALAKREKVTKNKAESIKRYIAAVLNGESFKTPKVAYGWRRSTTVEVYDPTQIPKGYLIEQEPKVDKAGIKAAFKQGYIVPGAVLVEHINLQIK